VVLRRQTCPTQTRSGLHRLKTVMWLLSRVKKAKFAHRAKNHGPAQPMAI
jgi:hypothetical protein